MTRLVVLAALLALLFTADCSGPPCIEPVEEQILPVSGAWELALETPELGGVCNGIETRPLLSAPLRAELGVVDEDLVHLDLAGVHAEGRVQGDQLYAEGWAPASAVRDGPEGPGLPMGVVIDGAIDDPRNLDGELLLRIEGPRGICEVTAWFHAQPLPDTEGEPALCDAPVPAEPAAPVQAPEWEGGSTCG